MGISGVLGLVKPDEEIVMPGGVSGLDKPLARFCDGVSMRGTCEPKRELGRGDREPVLRVGGNIDLSEAFIVGILVYDAFVMSS